MNKITQAGFYLAFVAFVFMPWAVVTSSASEKEPNQDKVAVVNGSLITQHDFDREMSGAKRRLAGMGKPVEEDQLKKLKKQVLENLINFELLYQETQKNGIKIEEAAIDERLKNIKKRFPKDQDFNEALLKMHVSEADLRSQIRRQLAVKQHLDKQFVEKTVIPDAEVKSFYDSHTEDFEKPEMVKASHILIKIDPEADDSQKKKAEARKKIEDIEKRLKKGEDFESLARDLSQCPSSEKGGDLGYFTRGQMVKPFSEAAFALEPGEVSGIVETEFGYHLIKSIDKKPQTLIAYEDIKDNLQRYLKQKKVMKEVGEYTEDLKRKAKIERYISEN